MAAARRSDDAGETTMRPVMGDTGDGRRRRTGGRAGTAQLIRVVQENAAGSAGVAERPQAGLPPGAAGGLNVHVNVAWPSR